MEVWVKAPSWQRSGYSPDLEQVAKAVPLHDGRVKRDWLPEGGALLGVRGEGTPGVQGRLLAFEERPSYGHGRSGAVDLIPDGKGGGGYQSLRRLEDPDDLTLTRTPSRHYRHEEDMTEFRGQLAKDLRQQPASDTLGQRQRDQLHRSADSKTRPPASCPQPAFSQLQGRIHNEHDAHAHSQPQREVLHGGGSTGVSLEQSGPSLGTAHGMLQTLGQEKTGSGFHHTAFSSSMMPGSGSVIRGLYQRDDREESDAEDEYEGEEEYPLEEDRPEYSWHKEYDSGAGALQASSANADWKRPDIHLFKTSSYKGSITSERSSRLDPHTYQSYAAGLLYSSGRSEKFLKLQKHFAILERIGELDKISSIQPHTSPDESNSRFPTGQDFPSKEELEELYSELQEAKKNKEFFHETGKTEQLQWSPQKDLGLRKRERSLRDHVRRYRNLADEGKTITRASSPRKHEQIKRAVSFGVLYEKFGSCSMSQEKRPTEFSQGRPFHEDKGPAAVGQRRQACEHSAAQLAGLHSGTHKREADQQKFQESRAAFSLEAKRTSGQEKYVGREMKSDLESGGYGGSDPHLSERGGTQQHKSSKTYFDEHSNIYSRKQTKPEGISPKQESHIKLKEPPGSYTHGVSYTEEKFGIESSKECSPVKDLSHESRSHSSVRTPSQQYNDVNRKEITSCSRPEAAGSEQPATKPEQSAHDGSVRTLPTKQAEESGGPSPKDPKSDSKDGSGHTNPRDSKSAPREMSYLQLMDSAAKRSRQRAIHGTHLDPRRNEYEVYVEEVKKMTKADINNLHIRSVSAPHSALKPPSFGTLPRSQSSKDSFFSMEEASSSPDAADVTKKSGGKLEMCPEVVVDSATRPRPGLLVKFGPADLTSSDEVTTPPVPALRQIIKSSVKGDGDSPSTTGERPRLLKDSAYDPADSSDTTDSEIRSVRQRYSEMPDIIQMERDHDRSRKNTPQNPEAHNMKSQKPDTDIRAQSTETVNTGIQKPYAYNTRPQKPDTHNARPQNPNKSDPLEISGPIHQYSTDVKTEGRQDYSFSPPKQSLAPHPAEGRHSDPGRKEPPAVFHVRDLRNLAANNEFSPSQLSWMKRSPAGRREGGDTQRTGEVPAQTPESHRSVVSQKSPPHFDPYSCSKADPRRSGSSMPEAKNDPLTEQVSPAYRQVTVLSETSTSRSTMERKTVPAVSAEKPSPISFKPTLSQSGPSFSSKTLGAGSRAQPAQSPIRANVAFVDPHLPSKGTTRWADVSHSSSTGAGSGDVAGRSVKRAEVVFTNAPAQSKELPRPADFAHKTMGRESDCGSVPPVRRPGDGDDSRSRSPDGRPGQLRKWTAVADIYRDVEKSWSPTREARPFPPDNNSSISSTDTFIVKETDDEDSEREDMESSGASVSHLREIFERRQRVNKSKSEPNLSMDSSDEPVRPRSAKSQTGLHSLGHEERSAHSDRSGFPRTVSGDLAELRQHYGDSRVSDTGPGSRADQTSPTDVALKAWVQYTGRSRYDPYLPPEDILKEVSAAATGRKLDVPRKTHHRPSNVSKMTLEYFDQIGSEWQQSSARGSIRSTPQPGPPERQPTVEQKNTARDTPPSQPGLPPSDRRNLSHQYVNEQTAFSATYAQTDDLKLKQSQLASQFAGGPQHAQHQPDWTPSLRSTGNNHGNVTGRGESRPSEGAGVQGAAGPRSWTPAPRPRSQPPAARPRSYPSSSHTPRETDSAQMPAPRNFHCQSPKLGNSRDDPQHQRRPERGTAQPHNTRPVPPEPSRPPPVSPRSHQRLAQSQPKVLQHRHSRSSDSEQSSGDYGGVYCVSTGAVWYGVEAEEAAERPQPAPAHSPRARPSNAARRQPSLQQPHQGGGSPTNPPYPTPRHPLYSSATLGRKASAGTAPAPPTRGAGVSGAQTLPHARSGAPLGSSLSAVEQLGVKSPPPSAAFGSAASAGLGGSDPIPSARAFKHQTIDARRPRPEPVDPEKERRRREEEEAYRKKRLEELYEQERLKKIKKDEADAEARRHHDYFTNAQKSPISPNRFDDTSASLSSLSPSTPGSLGTLERKEQQLSIPPERRRGFQIQGKARALYNFNAQNPRELSFRKNDIIYLLRQVDKNWFEGERHGRVGIFPTNYVEVVTSIEAARAAAMQAEGQGRAKYTFTAQSSVELSIRKGEFVVLLRRVDDNWYEGRIGNRQGIFPVSYIEITREPSTPLITPAPSVITTPMTGTPEMLSPVSCDAAPTPPPQPSPSAFASHQSPTAPYGYRQPHQQTFFGSGSAPLLAPASSVSRQNISLSRQDPDLSSPRSPIANAKSLTSNSRSPISPGGKLGSPRQGKRVSPGQSPALGPSPSLQVDIKAKAKPYANGQAKGSTVPDDDLAVTRYRALYAYRPQNEDELELREGDEVFVMEKCDDGWFVGTSAATGCFGTFPGNYVQKIYCKSGWKLKPNLM